MLQTSIRVEAQHRRPVLWRNQLFAFLVLACVLLPFYRFELEPDGISYLSIAGEYAHHHWHEAVNAYWGPLYSWLLAILLLLQIPGIVATRIIAIASGAVALYAVHLLSKRILLRPFLQETSLWLTALILLSFVVESNTPDLLFSALLLLYTAVIFDPAYPKSYAGVLCGLLGALSFYTKSYGFAFFICHFCLFAALGWSLRGDRLHRQKVIRQFAYGLTCFAVLCAGWIVVLHAKYGIWTLGTTGDFNYRLVGPQSAGYPQLRQMLVPPGEHAITAWEDPWPAWLARWSVAANAGHELKLVDLNIREIAYFWSRESVFLLISFIAYVLLCLRASKHRWEWLNLVVTICLFSGGYIFLTVEDRYFWFPELLLVLIAFRTIELVLESTAVRGRLQTVLIAIVVISFAPAPLRTLRGHFRRQAALYRAAQDLKQSGKIQHRLASCESWAQSAYVAYLVQKPYYGVMFPEAEAGEIARELNPDFKRSPAPQPTALSARQELSSMHVGDVLMWPDCPIQRTALGPVVADTGEFQVIEVK